MFCFVFSPQKATQPDGMRTVVYLMVFLLVSGPGWGWGPGAPAAVEGWDRTDPEAFESWFQLSCGPPPPMVACSSQYLLSDTLYASKRKRTGLCPWGLNKLLLLPKLQFPHQLKGVGAGWK